MSRKKGFASSKLSNLVLFLSSIAGAAIYAFAALGFVTWLRIGVGYSRTTTSNVPSTHGYDTRSCNCGNTVTDAISRGCKYDLLASAWLPDHCRDDELLDEFNRSGPGPNGEWTYYANTDGSETLNTTEVGLLADSPTNLYYTSLRWHVVHCHFYWLKMWRQRFTKTTLETRYDNERHIRHCGVEFLNRKYNLDDITTLQGAALKSDKS